MFKIILLLFPLPRACAVDRGEGSRPTVRQSSAELSPPSSGDVQRAQANYLCSANVTLNVLTQVCLVVSVPLIW